MNEMITKRNDLLAKKVIKGLESRNMKGFYAHSKAEALQTALGLIPDRSTVTMGGSVSAREIGLVDAMKVGNYIFIDRDMAEDKRAAALAAYDVDVFLASCNAMTEDGVLVNIDGKGNRVAALSYAVGKRIYLLAGKNKVCPDLASAIDRARNVAAPKNLLRFPGKRPCTDAQRCFDCRSADRGCCIMQILMFKPMQSNKVELILIDEDLGY